jgi:N-methylhydantoinase B/oxoprolinase/acetone carboxylase alpha subunit
LFDPIKLEIFKNIFSSIAEEMGMALCRSAYSPNIKERRDYSCALFDAKGQMVAQAAHLPIHMGSMPYSVKSAIKAIRMDKGDTIILNDPFKGGTHLPDLTMISPVYIGRTLRFYVANRAHHADIGGMSPGSLPLSREIFQEGVRIPPLKLARKGSIQKDLLELILANVRTPEEREGDLMAQFAANRLGERRLMEVACKYSYDEVISYMKALQDYAGRMTEKAIEDIPDGIYSFEDFLDNDGLSDTPVRIHVTVHIKGRRAKIDFSKSSPQIKGCMNATLAITLSAVYYVFRCLSPLDTPSNEGCMQPLEVIAPLGTVVNAQFPAAVAGGNIEVSQRIVDVLLGSLSRAVSHRIPAASSGSMNNITIGGWNSKESKMFTYYETIAGGSGASCDRDGVDAVHTHMTNTMNTPIEALENAYPLRVLRYEIRKGSGGKGLQKGGCGIRRDIQLLTDCEVTVLSDRRKFPPYGLQGGSPGKVGENILISKKETRDLGGKFTVLAKKGDVISIRTPGGGGFGKRSKDNEYARKI